MDTQRFNDYLEKTSKQTLLNEYMDRNQKKNFSETSFTLMRDIATVYLKYYDYAMSNYVYEHLQQVPGVMGSSPWVMIPVLTLTFS